MGRIKITSGMFLNSFTSHFLEDYTSLACSLVIDSKTSMNRLFTHSYFALAKHLELFFREGRSAKSVEVGIFLSSKKTGTDPGMSNMADGMLVIPWNTKWDEKQNIHLDLGGSVFNVYISVAIVMSSTGKRLTKVLGRLSRSTSRAWVSLLM